MLEQKHPHVTGQFVARGGDETVRALIADDQPFFLDGLERFLIDHGHSVAARASDAREIYAAIERHDPDLILLDAALPPSNGVEVLRTLRSRGRRSPIILLTAEVNAAEALEAMRLQVNGIVVKHSAPDLLARCIDAALAGESWIDRDIMKQALKESIHLEGSPQNQPTSLTHREQSIALLVAKGLSNHEIAERINVTDGTIKVHLHNIYRKLAISSRTMLAVMAREQDWV